MAFITIAAPISANTEPITIIIAALPLWDSPNTGFSPAQASRFHRTSQRSNHPAASEKNKQYLQKRWGHHPKFHEISSR